jgi:hypothetical protein
MVITVVTTPFASSVHNTYLLRKDAHYVVAQCQNARFQAVASNVQHRLQLNGNNIDLQRSAGAGNYSVVESYALSPGVTVVTPWGSDPVFSPRGTVSAPATITLGDSGGARRTVSISITGFAREQ